MGMDFTAEQQAVIDLRNANLIVSAAAGSGKTAVLVERIISLITDREKPADIDRFLIVTFTKAAAAEMKERLSVALLKLMEEHPEDKRLLKQESLIQNAMICTIDSFAFYVVRNHFTAIGLEPGFRPMDDGEKALMEADAMEMLLEEEYEKQLPEFLELVESYTAGTSEDTLEGMISALYRTALSEPFPERWLKEALLKNEQDTVSPYDSAWVLYGIKKAGSYLKKVIRACDEGIRLSSMEDGPAAYLENFAYIKNFAEIILNSSSYRDAVHAMENYSKPRLSSKKGKNEDPDIRARAKALADSAKELMEKAGVVYSYSEESLAEDIRLSSAHTAELIRLTLRYLEIFDGIKREKNVLDFPDMEHLALKILYDENEKTTPAAEEYRDYFEYVFTDEYQDSNMVQEYLLKAVVGEDNGFFVGDVKQSIYGFRHARPQIFLNRYERSSDTGTDRSIDLNKNFRSRENILTPVNDIFNVLMTKDRGGIEYDERARLYAGNMDYPEYEGSGAEYIKLYLSKDEDRLLEDSALKNYEALLCAKAIKDLFDKGYEVYDRERGKMRPVRYSDIVILVRQRGYEEALEEACARRGIPLYHESSAGYFDTPEIKLVLNALKVIDNPDDDISLYGTLTGFLKIFSDEDMAFFASLKKSRGGGLYENIVYASEDEGEIPDKIRRGANAFLGFLKKYRELSREAGVRELTEKMINENGFSERISAMPGGLQRRANLSMLLERADGFEQTSYRGLFRFVRYIKGLKDRDVDYGEAAVLDEKADVVRLMTIHKSKGLEFPVVIMPGLSQAFRFTDSLAECISDSDMGIALKAVDTGKRVIRKGFKYNVFSAKKRADAIAEEIRLLYVALTRAKEKLILIDAAVLGKEKLTPDIREPEEAGKYADLLRYAIINGDFPEHALIRSITEEELAANEAAVMDEALNKSKEGYEEVPDPGLLKEFERALEYTYAFPAYKGLFAKTTVTELKKAAYDDEPEAGETRAFPEKEVKDYVPSFIKPAEDGARRGTETHKLMENLPFDDLDALRQSKDLLNKHIEEEHRKGRLKNPELINLKEVVSFISSDLAKRMEEAKKEGKLYREQPFFFAVPATEFDSDFPEEEDILVQGVIDAFFEEDGALVLVDYKTDRLKSADDFIKLYAKQLEIYARALEQIRGLKVKEKLIYSFCLGSTIEITSE